MNMEISQDDGLSSVEQAKKLLEEDKRQREEKCRAEISEVFNKYRCVLVVQSQNIDALNIHLTPIVQAIE